MSRPYHNPESPPSANAGQRVLPRLGSCHCAEKKQRSRAMPHLRSPGSGRFIRSEPPAPPQDRSAWEGASPGESLGEGWFVGGAVQGGGPSFQETWVMGPRALALRAGKLKRSP